MKELRTKQFQILTLELLEKEIVNGFIVRTTKRRDGSVAAKVELVEILYSMHFYEHFAFGETDRPKR